MTFGDIESAKKRGEEIYGESRFRTVGRASPITNRIERRRTGNETRACHVKSRPNKLLHHAHGTGTRQTTREPAAIRGVRLHAGNLQLLDEILHGMARRNSAMTRWRRHWRLNGLLPRPNFTKPPGRICVVPNEAREKSIE